MLKTVDEACDSMAEWCQETGSYAGQPLATGFAVPDCVVQCRDLWRSATRLPGPILQYGDAVPRPPWRAGYGARMAYAPYRTGITSPAPLLTARALSIMRWGADASSDVLRRFACCTRSGRKDATIQIPGWGGLQAPVRG
jgi:hypothetical protein